MLLASKVLDQRTAQQVNAKIESCKSIEGEKKLEEMAFAVKSMKSSVGVSARGRFRDHAMVSNRHKNGGISMLLRALGKLEQKAIRDILFSSSSLSFDLPLSFHLLLALSSVLPHSFSLSSLTDPITHLVASKIPLHRQAASVYISCMIRTVMTIIDCVHSMDFQLEMSSW